MKKGIVGKKLGMTQIYDENGTRIPVTVIEVGPCPVLALRQQQKDGQFGRDAHGNRSGGGIRPAVRARRRIRTLAAYANTRSGMAQGRVGVPRARYGLRWSRMSGMQRRTMTVSYSRGMIVKPHAVGSHGRWTRLLADGRGMNRKAMRPGH